MFDSVKMYSRSYSNAPSTTQMLDNLPLTLPCRTAGAQHWSTDSWAESVAAAGMRNDTALQPGLVHDKVPCSGSDVLHAHDYKAYVGRYSFGQTD